MAIDRLTLLDWFAINRRRSRELFDSVAPDAYESRPIPLRNPICFYEGHLPAFNVNTLVKRGLGEDLVIAPYATALAAMVDPAAAVANFRRLAKEGALRRYGFYEALDYTPRKSYEEPEADDTPRERTRLRRFCDDF